MPIVIFSGLAIILLLASVKSGVVSSLLMFVMAGSVPSTNLVVSPTAMMSLVGVVLWLLILHAAAAAIRLHRQRAGD